jgi:hypothetical protein
MLSADRRSVAGVPGVGWKSMSRCEESGLSITPQSKLSGPVRAWGTVLDEQYTAATP